ncbi:phosphate/phosphite/phosphonate ABC transporter substrate-binding protein [Synechocystis sp. PCC 7509]|uniref:phosphate/phosphite/phosphonate ABC transporter substrate-binding protein n=1 Tax=Synechocystis sp. PCC 7509 TaxID=927677 RepID=UPI0002AC943B|nr:PhnD/SsuA/transferrin family substrate-binding protein [Synechocystis sp. PCC 7509]
MQLLSKNKNKGIVLSAIVSAIALAVGAGIFKTWQLNKPCASKSEKRIWGTCYKNLAVEPLVIGIASPPKEEDYSTLATYLQKQLNIKLEIDRDTPYGQNSQRIASKEWDIAFTRSPIFSIVAEDNNYFGIATMYPDRPLYYRAALYVRADSEIESIADINSTTTIALGSPESAPTFHLPIYTLYGKSLKIGTGYSPTETKKLVKLGNVDIGSSRYDVIKNDSQLRIIHLSKAIPGAGVYLSPKLSKEDRNKLNNILLNAPAEIRTRANYGDTKIPDYSELKKIVFRTESIISCPEFKLSSLNLKKTVDVFCKRQNQPQNTIQGQVTEYTVSTSKSIEFKVVTPANKVFRVIVSRQTLNQIPINPIDAVDEFIQIKNVAPKRLEDGSWQVTVTEPNQLALVGDFSLD